ncbi:FtsX-like permease family protein [Jeotgalibacillus salarius]|uniref:FtsX-like permease family protein n=2 Tax=Jeotgalibacillus salarius TaxID=546023 RepID=A0A4Y8LHZ5_9BACL|nr:FtsX-like permease family protein [Jeotgalibacillus salarius]
MAWLNISANRMRSFLTMLGIVIGVGAIIALMTIVNGATASINEEVSTFGADRISIQIQGTEQKAGMTSEEIADLTEIEGVRGVSPTLQGMVASPVSADDISLSGRSEVYFEQTPDALEKGRGLLQADIEQETPVAVIGAELANQWFPLEDPINKEVTLNGRTFTVVGVLAPSSSFSVTSVNELVMIPYPLAQRVLGVTTINQTDLYMEAGADANGIVDQATVVLRNAFNQNEDVYSVTNFEDALASIDQINSMLSMLLVGIASISLLVGGIGIMNMMLVSVTERTSEIGLRKALGASPGYIQLQFLLESIFLSLLGGLIGIGFGAALAFLASLAMGIGFTLSGTSIVIAAGFSMIIGVIFGFVPARKASRLNPIEALRSA